MKFQEITVVDLTIREGMQYRGLMFSPEERLAILEFQEALGVDITQVGYPPAHISEREAVKNLFSEVQKRKFKIHVTGLCRALVKDVGPMLDFKLNDFHLHTVFTEETLKQRSLDSIYESLADTIKLIRSKAEKACVEISLIDVGKTDASLLEESSAFLINQLGIDIITLPDTSGIMAPNQIAKTVKAIVKLAECTKTRISVHCHNDMGLASANTIMGVTAGATVIQVSALGIGERNGLGDIFVVSKLLKDQGYQLNVKTENIKLFQEYYKYVDELCRKKTNFGPLNYNTPFFGQSIKTHVAGTHGTGKYGVDSEEDFFLNVLCGKHLVKKYLKLNEIVYEKNKIDEIVTKTKDESVKLNRSLSKEEMLAIVSGSC